jgi:hypothetical protein
MCVQSCRETARAGARHGPRRPRRPHTPRPGFRGRAAGSRTSQRAEEPKSERERPWPRTKSRVLQGSTIHYAYAALHQSPNCHVPTAKVHDRNNTLDSLNYSPGYHPRSALGLASRGRGRDNQGRKFKLWLELRRLPQILLVLVRHTIN